MFLRILLGRRVHVYQLDTMSGGFFFADDLTRPGDPGIADFRHHDALWLVFKRQPIGNGAQSHGTAAAENQDVPAFLCPHDVFITARFCVVIRVISTNAARDGLRHGTGEIGITVIGPETACLDDVIGKNAVFCISAAPLAGVSRRFHLSGNCRLLGEFLPRLEPVLPLFADLDDIPRKFVADDHRILVHIIGHPLVLCSLLHGFPCGHADGIRDHLDQDLVVCDFRQLEFLQPDVIHAIQANRSCLHAHSFLPVLCISFLVFFAPAGSKTAGFSFSVSPRLCSLPACLQPWPVFRLLPR